MEYVNDINIIEAVINVLDNNADEPILNEYKLDLSDEIYKFLYKHIEKAFKDEELKYAVFNQEKHIVKEISQEFLTGKNKDIISIAREFSKQMFYIMEANRNIPSCDLITVYISTDHGPMLGILKMDYIKNFTHRVDFVDEKIGIGIVEQSAGLPASSQKVQKCAFIKPIRENQAVDLMIIDKQKKSSKNEEEEYGANYFTNHYLGCTVIQNERDMTKRFMRAAESFTRNNIIEDTAKAIEVRDTIKTRMKVKDTVNVNEIARDIFKDDIDMQENFNYFMESQGVERDVQIDKDWIEKKFKKVRLNIDREIDLYLSSEAYHDNDKFEVVRNGDGTVNIVIKRIKNFIEK
ncbi:nucleoid-associated protein [Clostridium sp.]|uniref:nucleoid-associated protein n=1 Tax=Clostridium sp. TaxID=1506 RepID=UPI003992F10B